MRSFMLWVTLVGMAQAVPLTNSTDFIAQLKLELTHDHAPRQLEWHVQSAFEGQTFFDKCV